jgi:hypothetical protein
MTRAARTSPPRSQTGPPPGAHRRAVLGLAAITVVMVLAVTGTPWDWWFEDDTAHRVFVRDNPDPWAYFTPDLVAELTLGQAVTPWFAVSFWVDHRIHPGSPTVAYVHTAISLYLAAVALYLVMVRFTPWAVAFGTTALWLSLPSTVVITEFLSTRHYLEGLLFSLVGIWCALESRDTTGWRRALLVALAAALYLLSCGAKEVYVTATWCSIVALFVTSRRWASAAVVTASGVAYALYRMVSLGGFGRDLDLSFAADYHLFVLRWPQIFAGNPGGYVLAMTMAIVAFDLFRRRRIEARSVLLIAAMVLVMAATVLPVTANITHQYRSLGPWFRVVFLLNTFVLAAGGWALARLDRRRTVIAVAAVAAAVILPGGIATARNWDASKAEYRREARFYLEHPDRLLYSRLPAPWFLWGVHELYRPDEPPHYITWRLDRITSRADVASRSLDVDGVWVFDDGSYGADPELLAIIRDNASRGVQPLHRGWTGTGGPP